MSARNTVTPGARFGRWTVVRSSSPARRCETDSGSRPRVLTRCVCGHEQVSWAEDLVRGKSTGCASRRCAARYEASLELRREFDEWITGWLVSAAAKDRSDM